MRATTILAFLFGGLAAVVAAPVPKDAPLPPVTAEHLKASQNNLKQIGLAFHNFESANGRLPTDIMDSDGKPLLSWRVLILPYIEEDTLYKSFNLTEPWDSEQNKKLIAKMPKIYAAIRVKGKPGMTYYQTFSGEGALFGGKNKQPRLVAIADGTSNTGMVFEAGEPVIWTKPQDLPFDAKKALPKLGGMFDGACNAVRCDGSVLLMKKNPDETLLKAFTTPAGGEVIDFQKLEK